MTESSRLIELFAQNTPLAEIERLTRFDLFTPTDYEDFFAEIERLKETQTAYDMLGLLYKAVKDKNYWYEVRVLAPVILRPDSFLDKDKLLKRMVFCLEQIKSSLTKLPKSDPAHMTYRRYLCDYLYLRARISDDAGQLDTALKEYQAAQKAYTELSILEPAKEIELKITRLMQYKQQGTRLFPMNMLADRREQLDQELTNLLQESQEKSKKIEEINTQLKYHDAEIRSSREKLQALNLSYQAGIAKVNELQTKATEFENRCQELQASINSLEEQETSARERLAQLTPELDLLLEQERKARSDTEEALIQFNLQQAQYQETHTREINEHMARLAELASEENTAAEHINTLQQQASELQAEINKGQEELSSINTELKNIRQEVITLRGKSEHIEEHLQVRQKQFDQLAEEVLNKSSESDTLTIAIRGLKTELTQLNNQIKEKNNELAMTENNESPAPKTPRRKSSFKSNS